MTRKVLRFRSMSIAITPEHDTHLTQVHIRTKWAETWILIRHGQRVPHRKHPLWEIHVESEHLVNLCRRLAKKHPLLAEHKVIHEDEIALQVSCRLLWHRFTFLYI